MRFSKLVILLCIAMTTAYTVFNLWLCAGLGEQPSDVLTAGVFAMYSVEFGSLALIKHGETKYGEDEEEDDDAR